MHHIDILVLPTKGPPHNFLVTFFNITDLAKFSKEILQTFVPHYFNTSNKSCRCHSMCYYNNYAIIIEGVLNDL